MPKLNESVVGTVYGRLTVLREAPRNNHDGQRRVVATCTCGTSKTVRLCSLRSGNTTSCGCVRTSNAKAMGANNRRHGHAARSGATAEYNAWCAMLKRCYRPSTEAYQYYGARGIRVCDQWRDSFDAFLTDVGRKPSPEYSLDRKDNDGNYEPGNVRWATSSEQNSNKRYRAA